MKCNNKRIRQHIHQMMICVILLLFFSSSAIAQQIQVTGTVTDKTGETVIGASVIVVGAKTGTVTDIDGKYSISADANATLEFSYLGMKTTTVPVNGRNMLNVIMEEDSQGLEEVVVIGYGVQKKKDLTTSVASVSADEWADRPIISAQQALQGKAAGVQIIQPSGKPGVGMSVRVRGATSINAGNDPLYVVDGIPTNDITNLSASDIADMQILKDASSAAIYGARAANGVVLITTKRGSAGKAQVSLSMYAGFSNVAKGIKTLKTKQYYDLIDEIYGEGYIDRTDHSYTNWNKEMYGTGVQQNYQLSISGGNEKTKYYLSGGYQSEEGIIKPADYDRFSFRANIESTVKDWLKVSSNVSVGRTTRRDAADNQAAGRGGVVMSILNTPPFVSVWKKDKPNEYQPNPFQASWENPYAQANTYDMNNDMRFMGNVALDFTILEGLHFKPSISFDYTDHKWDKFVDPVKTQYGREVNGRGEHADDSYQTWVSENIVTYDTSFDKKHNLSLLAGTTYQNYTHENAYMSVQNFVEGVTYKNFMTLNYAGKYNDAKTEKDEYALMSYIARVQYNYLSKYLFTANFRADGSSKLHPDHRWGYFPSVSAGWRFSSEDFFQPLTKVVDDAKIRFGWGVNGNQNGIGNYDYLQSYNLNKTTETDPPTVGGRNRWGNRDLKWETTSQYNLGFDFTLLNTRLTASFDLYYKKTKDLLLQVKLPSHLGIQTFPMRNDGEMVNKGFEFNINSQNLTGTFKWDTNLNMSFNRNKLTKLSLTKVYYEGSIESNGENVIMIREGYPLGTFFGYVSQGVDPETGDIIYKDLNDDGQINESDRKVIGDAQPDFIFGITNNFSWKNLTLSVFFQGSYGNDIFNATRIDTEGMFDTKNQTETVLNRWKRPGMISDVPRAGNINNSRNSTRFVEDGSYIRLKTLTLSYNFDRKLIKPLGVEGLSVYATTNNLFTLTKYRGYDPELNMGGNSATQLGIDFGTYPQTRSFIFGLNLSF